jgi:hypothetical protein
MIPVGHEDHVADRLRPSDPQEVPGAAAGLTRTEEFKPDGRRLTLYQLGADR